MNLPDRLRSDQLYLLLNNSLLLSQASDSDSAHLNPEENALLAYFRFDHHVEAEGFVALIAAGLGHATLDSPFAEILRRWGAKTTPDILEQARPFYREYGAEIERLAAGGTQLAELQSRFPQFAELDAAYYDTCEDDFPDIAAYVRDHPQQFQALMPA